MGLDIDFETKKLLRDIGNFKMRLKDEGFEVSFVKDAQSYGYGVSPESSLSEITSISINKRVGGRGYEN